MQGKLCYTLPSVASASNHTRIWCLSGYSDCRDIFFFVPFNHIFYIVFPATFRSWVFRSIVNVREELNLKKQEWRICPRVANENISVAVGGSRNQDAVAFSSACENFVICLNTFNYACAICWRFSRVQRTGKGVVKGGTRGR